MTGGAHWSGNLLFLGTTLIGRVEPDAAEGPNHVLALSYLPGAAQVVGHHKDTPTARRVVETSANSRMHAMLGVSIKDVSNAVQSGRDLRKVGRAIYRAGIWTCDRPAYAHAMFNALAKALEIPASEAPQPLAGTPNDTIGRSSVVAVSNDGTLVD